MKVYQRATELLEAEVGDELVALEPELGMCFAFNPVATAVWQQLKTPQTFDELAGQLLREYDVGEQRCSTELQQLLEQMVEKRLIVCKSQ